MIRVSKKATLVVPGPVTITFNVATGGTGYFNDPSMCSGFDQPPIRKPVEDAPQTDGGIVFAGLKGPRHLVIGGWLRAENETDEDDWLDAIDDLADDLQSALEAILGADGTYTYDPDGVNLALTVQCDIPVSFPTESDGINKKYLFGLVAANPDFS